MAFITRLTRNLFFFKVIYSILKHREKINEKMKVLKTKD